MFSDLGVMLVATKARLSPEQRYANRRACQENYRHRVRRFTLQFSLKDTEVLEWFEKQTDKGKYLKELILTDKERYHQLQDILSNLSNLQKMEVEMEDKTINQKALEILEHTNDGNDLLPAHLSLLEMAVNDQLNEKGIEMFNGIHKQVIDGKYKQPYLQGVEFMTHDHEGYVYFKGQHLEHFSSFYTYTLEAKDYLERLQSRSLFIEGKGLDVCFSNVMNMSDELEKEYMDDILHQLHSNMAENAIVFSQVKFDNHSGWDYTYLMSGTPDDETMWNNKYAADFVERTIDRDNCHESYKTKAITFVYGKGEPREATDDELKTLNLCFSYLSKNNMLEKVKTNEFEKYFSVETEVEDEDEAEM